MIIVNLDIQLAKKKMKLGEPTQIGRASCRERV